MTLPENDRAVVISHRIIRAREAYDDVVFLLENDKLSMAVSRAYYGLFYMVNALALKHGFSTGKHQKLIGWFNKEFVLTGKVDKKFGKILHRAYDNRMSGDYDDVIDFSREEVEAVMVGMKEFLDVIESVINSK